MLGRRVCDLQNNARVSSPSATGIQVSSPNQLRKNVVVLTREQSTRVDQYVIRVGSKRIAQMRLGIGEITLDAARDQGRMQDVTRDRILAALDIEDLRLPT